MTPIFFHSPVFSQLNKSYHMGHIYLTTLTTLQQKNLHPSNNKWKKIEAHFTMASTKLWQILEHFTSRWNVRDVQQLDKKSTNGLHRSIQQTRNKEVLCFPRTSPAESGQPACQTISKRCNLTSPIWGKQQYEERGKNLNAHMMMWSNILGVKMHMTNNFQATYNDILALSGLCKDHKMTTDPVTRLLMRSGCRASVANNYQLSDLLLMILRHLIKMSPDVCDSMMDLLCKINECFHAYDLTG